MTTDSVLARSSEVRIANLERVTARIAEILRTLHRNDVKLGGDVFSPDLEKLIDEMQATS